MCTSEVAEETKKSDRVREEAREEHIRYQVSKK